MNLQSFQSTKFALSLVVVVGLFGFLFAYPTYHIPTITAIIGTLTAYFTSHVIQKKQGN